jgi:hypothetical protein
MGQPEGLAHYAKRNQTNAVSFLHPARFDVSLFTSCHELIHPLPEDRGITNGGGGSSVFASPSIITA